MIIIILKIIIIIKIIIIMIAVEIKNLLVAHGVKI
jgi:hypothetical protein